MMKAEVMKQKKADNKGFSLVELIIVMAIMAILVGIVGTQAIPYMNRARESKDREILSAISTAAVTSYTTNAEDLPDVIPATDLYPAPATSPAPTGVEKWRADIISMTSYPDISDLKNAASSSTMQNDLTSVQIEITSDHKLIVTAVGTTLEPVESQL